MNPLMLWGLRYVLEPEEARFMDERGRGAGPP